MADEKIGITGNIKKTICEHRSSTVAVCIEFRSPMMIRIFYLVMLEVRGDAFSVLGFGLETSIL
jgi:hypothetical protein